MAFDVSKLESVLSKVTDPAIIEKLKSFLAVAESSGILQQLESRWPGIATVDADFHKVLDFLSKLDAAIHPDLPAIFAILDALFPKPAAA